MDRAQDEVLRQPGELNDYNLFSSHSALMDACTAALITRCFAPHSP
jgi:hypothetical protein